MARWTGGVPGAESPLAGAGVAGLPLPVGRVVARWTGVVLPLGAVAAGLSPVGRWAPRPAGASVGEGLGGWAAVRWTGGVPDTEPLLAAAGVDALPPSGRRTGDAGAVASPDAPGAGVVPGADAARWTGAPVGAGAGVTEPWAGEVLPAGAEPWAAGEVLAGGAESWAGEVLAAGAESWAGEVLAAGAEPGSARSASGDEGAVPDDAAPDDAGPEDAGAAPVVGRLAGNARRCTAGDPDGALVSDCRGRGAAGGAGTGVTRTPREAGAGALAGTAGELGRGSCRGRG
ncbi:hypothetical protein PEM37_39260 [Streptomyces sp. AD681]|uniref:hypothetical protein n=1 Tax=Streptomyces sp. AD681 TaxID=3019069 RepID=UPI0022F1A7C8|nr:hypothetical protein [Streptomyces sp. AD681]MDA5147541.1 hypothetical protein [Streptomyces sp. AD681]